MSDEQPPRGVPYEVWLTSQGDVTKAMAEVARKVTFRDTAATANAESLRDHRVAMQANTAALNSLRHLLIIMSVSLGVFTASLGVVVWANRVSLSTLADEVGSNTRRIEAIEQCMGDSADDGADGGSWAGEGHLDRGAWD